MLRSRERIARVRAARAGGTWDAPAAPRPQELAGIPPDPRPLSAEKLAGDAGAGGAPDPTPRAERPAGRAEPGLSRERGALGGGSPALAPSLLAQFPSAARPPGKSPGSAAPARSPGKAAAAAPVHSGAAPPAAGAAGAAGAQPAAPRPPAQLRQSPKHAEARAAAGRAGRESPERTDAAADEQGGRAEAGRAPGWGARVAAWWGGGGASGGAGRAEGGQARREGQGAGGGRGQGRGQRARAVSPEKGVLGALVSDLRAQQGEPPRAAAAPAAGLPPAGRGAPPPLGSQKRPSFESFAPAQSLGPGAAEGASGGRGRGGEGGGGEGGKSQRKLKRERWRRGRNWRRRRGRAGRGAGAEAGDEEASGASEDSGGAARGGGGRRAAGGAAVGAAALRAALLGQGAAGAAPLRALAPEESAAERAALWGSASLPGQRPLAVEARPRAPLQPVEPFSRAMQCVEEAAADGSRVRPAPIPCHPPPACGARQPPCCADHASPFVRRLCGSCRRSSPVALPRRCRRHCATRVSPAPCRGCRASPRSGGGRPRRRPRPRPPARRGGSAQRGRRT